MTANRTKQIVLAATLSVAVLVGCAPAPTTSQTPAAGTSGNPTATAPGDSTTASAGGSFAAGTSVNAITSSTAQVTSATDAKAAAVNDEGFVETASSDLETKEAASTSVGYATLAVDASTQASASASATVSVPAPKKAKPPRFDPKAELAALQKLEERREKAKIARDFFCRHHADYCRDEALIDRILDNQPWQPSADIAGAVYKTGSGDSTFTGDKGRQTKRHVSVLRVIAKAKPHHLIHGITDISDTYADGAIKTVHWEKSLQADGSYDVVYHHEYTGPKGTKWVTDWQKTLKADGTITGTGTFSTYDASGNLVSQETVTIGGTDGGNQTVNSGGTAASPSPAASVAPSAAPSVAPSAAPSAQPSAAAAPSTAASAAASTAVSS